MPSQPTWKASVTALMVSTPIAGTKTGRCGWSMFSSLEVRICPVAIGNDCGRLRPGDAKSGVVPPRATLSVGMIFPGHLVEQLAVWRERLKAVRYSARQIELLAVVGAQLDGEPTLERRGSRPHVDRDIEDGAHGATDQLVLPVRLVLPVNAAQRASAFVVGNAALHEITSRAMRLEQAGVEGTREEAALVAEALGLDDPYAHERRLGEAHQASLTVGMGRMKRPR